MLTNANAIHRSVVLRYNPTVSLPTSSPNKAIFSVAAVRCHKFLFFWESAVFKQGNLIYVTNLLIVRINVSGSNLSIDIGTVPGKVRPCHLLQIPTDVNVNAYCYLHKYFYYRRASP